jgi:hypothetical protein
MKSDHRQVLYRMSPHGRVESRLFERGEEIPMPSTWSDSPGKAKEKPIIVATADVVLPPPPRKKERHHGR